MKKSATAAKSVTTSNPEKLSKTEAVRQAIANGCESAKTGIPWIKENFGLDVNANHFHNIKSTLKNGSKKSVKKAGKKTGKKVQATTTFWIGTEPNGSTKTGNPGRTGKFEVPDLDPLLTVAQELKIMIVMHGKDTISGLVDLLS
jgi:hypothetical protein